MAEFSNPLKRGLQQMHAAALAHPDADLLTAFAEQSLTQREREQLLAHLASCSECRDVVALSLPDAPLSPPSAEPVRPLFWRWPILRWGAVAASVVIVAGAVLIGNQEHKKHSIETQQVAEVRRESAPNLTPAAPATQTPVQQTLPEIAGSSGVQRPKVRYERIPGDSQTASLPSLAKEGADKAVVEPQQKGEDLAVGKIVAGVVAPRAQPPAAVDDSASSSVYKRDAGIYSATAGMKSPVPSRAAPPPNATENVAVSSAVVPVESANADQATSGVVPTNNKPETQLAARQSIQLEQGVSKKKLTRFAAATNWRIFDGVLQRSFDNGQTWEQARPEANFRAVSTIGNEIWVGGANGLLIHSADAGQSWFALSPGITGDVASLQFIDPKHGAVKTSTGESWETKDGGKSWKKQ